ncbi:MAG: amidase domain-containing protein [Bacillota bacterium]|nr:amidase domain-containing protein [Bacillota bacterium]
MRKFVSLIIVMVVISALGIGYANALTSHDEAVLLIEKYYSLKDEIFLASDIQKVDELSNCFDDRGKEYLNYEIGRIKFFLTANDHMGWHVLQRESTIKVLDQTVKGNNVEYEVAVTVKIEYDFSRKVEYNHSYHNFVLTLVNGKMKILEDNYCDEFKNLHGMQTDFDSLIDKEIFNNESVKLNSVESDMNEMSKGSFSIKSEPGDYYDTYSSGDREDAVSYAFDYTDDTGGSSTTYYNTSQFKTYGTDDCQNFVSQCIWSGFGGTSSANKDLPMVLQWWANLTGEDNYDHWVNTGESLDWVTDNDDYNDYGIQGYSTSVNNILEGDYVYVPGHVMFINQADDLDGNGTVDYDEIYICSHTNNREDHLLADLYSSQPSNMVFVHITRFKWNTSY